ncbi:PE domain-containing protein, partial [Mycobacterium tuberculosis]|nr:PE domain-containing protein [Mycobacterium tuberculosis]
MGPWWWLLGWIVPRWPVPSCRHYLASWLPVRSDGSSTGADEVSAAVADLFGAHAQAYQALSAQAALFHEQFVQALTAAAGRYASTEAAVERS